MDVATKIFAKLLKVFAKLALVLVKLGIINEDTVNALLNQAENAEETPADGDQDTDPDAAV
ncbi:MAG: hypothetical protein IJ766_08675 [Clostridia bacterium]|nr:hypothetical protein [Clostridia bacterium]